MDTFIVAAFLVGLLIGACSMFFALAIIGAGMEKKPK